MNTQTTSPLLNQLSAIHDLTDALQDLARSATLQKAVEYEAWRRTVSSWPSSCSLEDELEDITFQLAGDVTARLRNIKRALQKNQLEAKFSPPILSKVKVPRCSKWLSKGAEHRSELIDTDQSAGLEERLEAERENAERAAEILAGAAIYPEGDNDR